MEDMGMGVGIRPDAAEGMAPGAGNVGGKDGGEGRKALDSGLVREACFAGLLLCVPLALLGIVAVSVLQGR